MRTDLESAMAAVIGSRDASERFEEDPAAFATEFGLTESEAAMLHEMAGDLAELTSSFVSKRCNTLRWNARRTIELLGEEGAELVEDFVEESPMSGSFREDAAQFGDFVIEETAERADEAPWRQLIAEMAVFERHRSDSFWDATGSLARGPHQNGSVSRADRLDPSSGRLVAGANLGHFTWDLRLPYRHRVRRLGTLPKDPCWLLFFHSTREPVLRSIRLRPDEADLISAVVSGSGEAAPEKVGELLRRLSWEGAVA